VVGHRRRTVTVSRRRRPAPPSPAAPGSAPPPADDGSLEPDARTWSSERRHPLDVCEVCEVDVAVVTGDQPVALLGLRPADRPGGRVAQAALLLACQARKAASPLPPLGLVDLPGFRHHCAWPDPADWARTAGDRLPGRDADNP
jgi:hypothetical protein